MLRITNVRHTCLQLAKVVDEVFEALLQSDVMRRVSGEDSHTQAHRLLLVDQTAKSNLGLVQCELDLPDLGTSHTSCSLR